MFTLLIASHNQSKIKRYQNLFVNIAGLKLVTLAELGITLKANEPFNTPRENAEYKAKMYGDLSHLPTIAIDEAVTTNFLPNDEQPGVFVRRLGGDREMNDEEILDAWKKIFTLYPGDDHEFTWDFRMSYYNPKTDTLKSARAVQVNKVATTFSPIVNPGYPMSSFLIPSGYDQSHSTLSLEERLQVDRRNLQPFVELVTEIVAEASIS